MTPDAVSPSVLNALSYRFKSTMLSVCRATASEVRNATCAVTIDCNQYKYDPKNPSAHAEQFKRDLAKYPNLTELKLVGRADREMLKALAEFPKIETLDLSAYDISDAELAHLAGLTNLQNLTV